MKNFPKNLFFILPAALIIFSCSKGENDPTPEPEPEGKLLEAKITPKQDWANIFEMMEFYVSIGDEDTNLSTAIRLSECYDSIVWVVPDLHASFKFIDTKKHTFMWGGYFFIPGAFDTYIHGYIGDEIVYTDKFRINILKNKDFLGFNWTDITPSAANTPYLNDLYTEGVGFVTYQAVHDDVPCMNLVYEDYYTFPNPGKFREESKKILSDYITSLYSEPTYTRADADLAEQYDRFFYFKAENASPEMIWVKSESVIALLKTQGSGDRQYRIYAEPNRENRR